MEWNYAFWKDNESDSRYTVLLNGCPLKQGIRLAAYNKNCTIIEAYAEHPMIPIIKVLYDDGATAFLGNINCIQQILL
jgi:hypothetical protein